ncbi:MAG: leucine-rich repeat domain-containing protein [Eubacterium sp.]|nr:leucine-rich repeat domain-containing protein [Eubacterium sp.]
MKKTNTVMRRVAITLVFVLLLSVMGVIPVGDNGTAFALTPDGDGWYLISTVDELNEIANTINSAGSTPGEYKIKLQADITLPDNSSGIMEYENWTPIKNFTGTFDGGGHVINNLKIGPNLNNTSEIGFFGKAVNATIKNVTFKGSSIKFYDQYVSAGTTFGDLGVVAGVLQGCTLSKVDVDNATVSLIFPGSTSVSNVSKFAGRIESSTMTDVSVNGGTISVTALNPTDTVTVTGQGTADDEVAKSGTTPAGPTNTPAVKTTAPTSTPATTASPAVTPTTAPTAEPVTGPAVTPAVTTAPATPSAAALPTAAPTAEPSETPKPIPAGTIFELNDFEYRVLNDGTVGFFGMDDEKTETIRIPDTVTGANGEELPVTRILKNAFNGEDKIKKVIFGKYIEVVEESAFEDCTSLRSVVASPVLRIIEKNAFRDCKNLRKMKLPGTIEYIGDYAFKNCKRMKSFIMGNDIKKAAKNNFIKAGTINITIGVGVFQNCRDLKRVVINVQVTVIGNSAFARCTKLSAIVVYSKQLKTVGNSALTGVHDCKISVYKFKLKKYKKLFKNKGQGKKVIVAKF